MSCRSIRIILLSTIGIAGFFFSAAAAAATTPGSGTNSAQQSQANGRMTVAYGNLPLSFEPNQGQTAKQVKWLARGPEYTLYLAGRDAVLEMSRMVPAKRGSDRPEGLQPTIYSSALKMHLLGAGAVPQSGGEDLQPGKANYFTGNDADKWQRDVPMYGKVRLQGVYPGIDLVYYGTQGQLEYDFVVSPGTDPSIIRLNFDGAKAELAADGDLVLPVEDGGPEVRFHKPVIYQLKDGVREIVDGSFQVAENHQVSFRLGAYDRSRELTIDPTLLFLGVLGAGNGNYETTAYGMTVDSAGEMILTGLTRDVTFPTTSGALQTTCNTNSPVDNNLAYKRCTNTQASSGFVTKISADGKSLVYSTYLHGLSGNEYGDAVAADAAGDAIILGATSSNDFPVTADAYQSICQPYYPNTSPTTFGPISPLCNGFFNGGGTEYTVNGPIMFIAKLNPSGSALLYSTFFGGTSAVYPEALALDSSGNIYFTGFVQDAYSTPNAYPNNGNGGIPFPVTASAYESAGIDIQASTLSELSANGHTLLYSTLMGQSTLPCGFGYCSGYSVPIALATGPNGMVYLGGYTQSFYFPTTPGVVTPACAQNPNSLWNCYGNTGFLSAFDTTKTGSASLVYSTYIGPASPNPASQPTYVYGLAADSSNNAYVTGYTNTSNYPTTTGVFQTTCDTANVGCKNSAFLSKINPAGTAYVWSTYFGGLTSSSGWGDSIAFDAKGQIYLYGINDNYGYDFPVVNPLGGRPGNSSSFAFVATFSSDAKKLLFATPLGNPSPSAANVYPINNNGIALDAEGNIYFAAYSTDNGTFATTSGTYATTATGPGNRSFFGKISPVLAPTATTLTVSPSTTITGQAVTFTATVAGTTQATPTPTGTVTLQNTNTTPATTLGSITLGANGSGTFVTSSLAAASYNVTATYSGDTTYDVSTSTAKTLTINTPTTATVNLSVPASASVGASVTFTATVSGSGGTPTGTVIFQDGGATLGSMALVNGSAGYSTSSLTIGQHSITASYSGDTVFASAVSIDDTITINGFTSAVALNASPASAHPGQTVALGATVTAVTGTATPTGNVTFLDGAASIGSVSIASGKASLNTTSLALGTHSITASYAGDSNFVGSTSTAQSVSVVPLATPTIVATPSPTAITTAQAFSVGVTVSGGGSNPTPTGTVKLSGGGYASSAVTLSGGNATINIPANSLTVGTDSLTISYSGDANYAAGTGTASEVVSAVPLTPTVTVAPATNTLDTGASLSVKATVTGSGLQPTGTVTLSGGGYTSSASTLVAGIYTFTIPANSLTSGADTLSVSYSGDSVYASGNGTAPVTVAQSVFTVSATTPTAVAPGTAATSTISVSSSTNYSGTVTFACALTSSPSGATKLPTCAVTNPTVTVSNGTASGSATVTVSSTSTSGELAWPVVGGKPHGWAGGGAVLAFLVFLGIPARRRNWRSMLGALALVAVLGTLAGCGGSVAAPSGTTAGSYTFTVTGTGSPSVSPAPTATFTLTVN